VLATNRNIFSALSGINFPLIAWGKNRTTPPPIHLLVLHFATTQSISLSLLYFAVQRMPEYLVLCIAVLYSLFRAVPVLDFTVIVAVMQCQPESSVQVVAKCITPLLSWNSFHTFSATPTSRTNSLTVIIF
jgi:hypothetical protein